MRKQTKEELDRSEGEVEALKESFLNPYGLPVMRLDDSIFFGGI